MTDPTFRPKTRLEMPLLMLCGMGFTAFFTVCGTLSYAMILVMSVVGVGSYKINDQAVDRATFLRSMIPFWLLFPIVLAGLASIVYGYWKERLWTREAIMGYWAVCTLGLIVTQLLDPQDAATFLSGFIMILLMWGVAAWYFYGKDSVRRYYGVLQRRADAVAHTSQTDGA